MRFLLLMARPDHFGAWDRASPEDQDRMLSAYAAFTREVRRRGAVVGGDALARPDEARTLRPAAGGHTVTAGPFAETVEQIGGFYLIDVPDADAALEVASLLPDDHVIEVRRLLEVGP